MLWQVGPYSVIAAICAALNVTVLLVGEVVGLHYAFSIAISFALCVCVGYASHCRWSFRAEPNVSGLVRYAVAMALNFPMAVASVWLFYDWLGLPMIVAAPVSTLSLTVLNFTLSRWAILSAGASK